MEAALLKIAKQINMFDEASFMSLWDKYAEIVRNFEPTKRWEEAALVFGFIQSLRMKNQLFNYNWALTGRPARENPGAPALSAVPGKDSAPASSAPGARKTPSRRGTDPAKRGKLIRLPSKEK